MHNETQLNEMQYNILQHNVGDVNGEFKRDFS